jgi:peptidylprolyl isomerase/FKBP-type peptidyl-prolyl cis-trans isomerase FklB
MKHLLYLFLFTSISISLLSCGDDDDDDAEWRENNEAAFAAVHADSTNYKAITMEGVYPGTICVKTLKSGPETGKKPILNDRVSVLYKGTYYNGTVFTDGTSLNDVPATFYVSSKVSGSIILGFSIALQNMRPGDRWEVWIPWYLAYGDIANGSIPPYTTLVYDMELVRILD